MTKIKKTINELLASWGKANQQIPQRNEALKSEITDKAAAPVIKIAHSRRHLPWPSFALAGVALLLLFISPKMTTHFPAQPELPDSDKAGLPNSDADETTEKAKAMSRLPQQRMEETLPQKLNQFSRSKSASHFDLQKKLGDFKRPQIAEKPAYIGSESPIKDAREFLKTTYSAAAHSRHVEESVQRIQVSIRGFGGRIDSSSSAERSGFVTFAVPADRFDGFKNEIKNLFGERFYSEHINTENLLPQKESIENQQQGAQKTLDQLRMELNRLIKNHSRIVAAIQSEIDANAVELANLRAEVAEDRIRREIIFNRIWELSRKNSDLGNCLHNENRQFSSNQYSYHSQIRNQEFNLANLDEQDRHLMKTVATVRGSISLSWISIWEIIDLYVPLYWLAALFLAGAVFFYFLHRRRQRLITV